MSSTEISCVICDDVRQEKSGKNTLIGVYNDVIVFLRSEWEKSGSSLGVPQLVFANFVANAPKGSSKLIWWLEDPNGKLFATKEKREADIEINDRTQAIMLRFTPLGFKELGKYRFCIEVGDFKYQKVFEVRVADSIGI